jgi:hypothetical protein
LNEIQNDKEGLDLVSHSHFTTDSTWVCVQHDRNKYVSTEVIENENNIPGKMNLILI